jgi:hypothetical protein
VAIQPRAGATPFVVVGNWLAIVLALVLALGGAAAARWGRHPER